MRLAQFELQQGNPAAAMNDVRPALYLDPRSTQAQAVYLAASREAAKAETKAKAKAKAKKRKKQKQK